MKTVFLVNPVAGGRDVSAELEKRLRALGLPEGTWHLERTLYPGHARELAECYARTGEPMHLFAAGGDGTLNEVISGAYPYKNAAVGCLPCGSGNDFLRNFGTKEEFLDLAGQLAGGEADIDLVKTDGGMCVSICSAGLDAQIAYGIPKFRRIPLCGGETAYRLSILQQLLGPRGRRLRITVDGEGFEETCLMTAVCNGGYYGGGFFAAPESSMQDGLLDVMIVRNVGLARIAKILPVYQKGLHMKDGQIVPEIADVIRFVRGRQIEIATADGTARPMIVNRDGECGPAHCLTAAVMPGAGRVLLPAAAFARYSAMATK